jgi:hypothetical protein
MERPGHAAPIVLVAQPQEASAKDEPPCCPVSMSTGTLRAGLLARR